MKTDEIIPLLLAACPSAVKMWEDYLKEWNGETPGIYSDMAAFAHHIVSLHYDHGADSEISAFFKVLEDLLTEGDEQVRHLATIGLIEDIQTVASWQPHGAGVFEHHLGARSRDAWNEVIRIWQGASSLADVVRREQKAKKCGT